MLSKLFSAGICWGCPCPFLPVLILTWMPLGRLCRGSCIPASQELTQGFCLPDPWAGARHRSKQGPEPLKCCVGSPVSAWGSPLLAGAVAYCLQAPKSQNKPPGGCSPLPNPTSVPGTELCHLVPDKILLAVSCPLICLGAINELRKKTHIRSVLH